MTVMQVLAVAPEVFPLVKTGGLAPETYGPPAPAMLAQIRRRRPEPPPLPRPRPIDARGPFAALAALKR